jgi:hypothetical protein
MNDQNAMPTPTQKLKINLFGEWWVLKRILLTPNEFIYFEQVAARINKPLHEALLDPFFYPKLHLEKIQTLDQLPGELYCGLSNHPKSQLDFWWNQRKAGALFLKEILSTIYLFPLYNVMQHSIPTPLVPGIYIEQKELGFIGSYLIQTPRFDLENCQFNIQNYQDLQLLKSVTYEGISAKFQKKEAGLIYQHSFVVG